MAAVTEKLAESPEIQLEKMLEAQEAAEVSTILGSFSPRCGQVGNDGAG